jgi:hypothetical protein
MQVGEGWTEMLTFICSFKLTFLVRQRKIKKRVLYRKEVNTTPHFDWGLVFLFRS